MDQPQRRHSLIRIDSPATSLDSPTTAKKAQTPPAARCGEVAGAKTAECAAICCCCPFAVIDIIVLAAVKLPAGVYRRVKRRQSRRRGRRMMRKLMMSNSERTEGGGGARGSGAQEMVMPKSPSAEVTEREEEMWAKFHGGGFWRINSQREIT